MNNSADDAIEYARLQASRARKSPHVATKTLSADRNSIPGYELLEDVRGGGQGVVYKAVQLGTKHVVAIKILHERLSARYSSRIRFRQEINLLGRLRHPNIVRLHDGGISEHRSYFVMDFIDGLNLDDYVTSFAPSRDELVTLYCKVSDAIQAAHVRGIVHRDLKPGNIIVDRAGEPHVLDFGLAKLTSRGDLSLSLQGELTVSGEFVGTPRWATPEQASQESDETDIRIDVYSLGLSLYYSLTGGQFPYPVDGPLPQLVQHILYTEPGRISRFSDAPADLETIVAKCLEKDASRRYQSAGDLGSDLRNFLAGRPIDARPKTALYVMRKLVMRHRGVATLISFLVLTLAVGFLTTTALYFRVRHAEGVSKRRFAEAQTLADSFIYGLDEKLQKGPTHAREFFIRTALSYLDGLSKEDKSDSALRLKLISGYLKVGDVQGNPTYPHLGNLRDAMESYNKGKKLADELLLSEPDDSAVLRVLASLYDRLGDVESQLEDGWLSAREYFSRAIDLRTKLLQSNESDTTSIRDLALSLAKLGNSWFDRNQFADARETYERSLSLRLEWLTQAPNDPEAMLWVAQAHRRLGELELAADRESDSVSSFKRGLSIAEDLYSVDRHDLEVRRELSRFYRPLGDFCHTQGDFTSALSYYEKSRIHEEFLLAADSTDLQAKSYFASGLIRRARAKRHLELTESAKRDAEVGTRLYEELFETKSGTESSIRDLVNSYEVLSSVEAAIGEFENALFHGNCAVQFAREIALDRLSHPRDKERLGHAYFSLGEQNRLIAECIGIAREKMSFHLLEAHRLYNLSLCEFQSTIAEGHLRPSFQYLPPLIESRIEETTNRILVLEE